MSFLQRKAERTKHFYANVYRHKQQYCSACSGSGKYDHDGSPECGCCDGTGITTYQCRGFFLKLAGVSIEFDSIESRDFAMEIFKSNMRRIRNSSYPSNELRKLFKEVKLSDYTIRRGD